MSIHTRCIAVPILALMAQLSGARMCELGDVYVSVPGKVSDWAGSYQAAVTAPDAWRREERIQIGRKYSAPIGGDALYMVGAVTADEEFVQGLNVTVGSPEVRCNGEALVPVEKTFYKLNLKQGTNTIEFRFAKRKSSKPAGKKAKRGGQGNSASLHVVFVDLDYIFTSVEDKITFARRAITFLGEKYGDYKSDAFLKELASLEAKGASDSDVEEFRYRALVADNPELDFDDVLFRQSRSRGLPSNWRGNSHYLRRGGKETRPDFSDSLRVLSLKDRSVRPVYEPADKKEGLMDICLHYDADRFLYSGVDTKSNTFQVYEMRIDGSGKTQKTPLLPAIDSYNGVYLPNGRILFCSTASLNSVPCVGGKDYVGTLFEIGADGTGMRQVTFDQENDWYPWVKESGRVMYHRWEYTDNSHYFTRILMEMNPDGTNNRSIYGSNSYWPNTMFYAKQIPGHSSKFVAVVSGHHGEARAGELWLFDSAKGDFETDGALRKIPGYGRTYKPGIVDRYVVGKRPLFLHPFPVSENFFLVSAVKKPSDRWGLYLVDTFDNMIKLCDSDLYQFEPVPVRRRAVPPVIPVRTDRKAGHAILSIQDIYAGPGLAGIPRGEVASVRIFTYGYAYRMTGSHDALAIEGGWDTKRVLGTVPVEEDGSVLARIPHSMPLSIQPLDKDGKALQVMRSWLAAQPGELVSCVGCHEPSRATVLPVPTIATRQPPRELDAWSQAGRPYGFGFKREIQPILDKYCVGCHDGSKANRPNFRDAAEQTFGKAHFGKSYMALHPYVRRPGPESDLHILTPMDYHASTSELFQMLEKGHYGVKVDDRSMRQLSTWVDLNVPYHATWTQFSKQPAIQQFAKLTVEYKKRYSNIDDEIEWMPPAPAARPEFVKPAREQRPAALKMAGWPLPESATAKPETKRISFGSETLTLVKIPAGRFVMGSVTGAPDEYPQAAVHLETPFWISTTEITNAQFRQFRPEHDSRVIDQQWKDHIYAGYPANRPKMPAIRVTWHDAMAFAQWLSEETGQSVNLPTEAQWEWAARAGSDQAFFFGSTGFERFANLADRNIGLLAVRGVDPQPVSENRRSPLNDFVPRDESFDDGKLLPDGTAQYQPNPWGLFDMHGNVAEWTRSSYKPYPYNARDGRNDAKAAGRRVVRGGSWRDRPARATASFRVAYQPFQRVFNVGFRVVIEEE